MKKLMVKIYDNYCFDKIFLNTKFISLQEKVSYIFRKYLTVLLRKKDIIFFGKKFSFDNPFTPILLQGYPNEIEKLNNKVDLKVIHSVLDIGANIGQWSFTLKSLFPHLKIFSFEPNPEIFPLLLKNAKSFSGWKCYNLGMGNGDKHKYLYYFNNGSSEASVYNKTDSSSGAKVKAASIHLIKLGKNQKNTLPIPSSFDLVKIDTEGSELEVLRSISGLSFKYLEIEISLKRAKGVTVKDVEKYFFKHTNVKAKLLHLETFNKSSPVADAIFSLSCA